MEEGSRKGWVQDGGTSGLKQTGLSLHEKMTAKHMGIVKTSEEGSFES